MNAPTWSILILPLLIVSGGIAYAGDVIGKTLGKKRLSFLGLRPKQTAQLFSIGSGVTILILSMGLILGFSEQAREAVFNLERIKARSTELTDRNRRLDQNNKALNRNNKELTTKGNRLLASTRKAENETRRANAELKKVEASLGMARLNLNRVEIRLRQVNELRLVAVRGRKMAEGVRDKLGPEIIVLERKRLELYSDVKRLEEEKRKLGENIAELQGALRVVLSTPLMYERGQIVHSSPIRVADQSSDEIRQKLEDLLHRASEVAVTHGASREGTMRAVSLARRIDLDGRKIEEAEQLDLIAKGLAEFDGRLLDGYDGQMIMDVVASRNCIKGDRVDAELRPSPNVRVFRRNEEIARVTVDGGQSPGKIYGHLTQLIEQGRKIAEENRLRPRRGEVYDPETNERVFDCLNKIQQARGQVVVRLIADRDIRSADYLRVRFETSVAPTAGERNG